MPNSTYQPSQYTVATETQRGVVNGADIRELSFGGGSVVQVTQVAHGFVAADVGRPLYLSGSAYAFAKADLEATAEVAGLINKIVDADTFQICLGGEIPAIGANLIEGGSVTLTAGEAYFLSATTAGKITTTPPTVVGHISKPIGIARTSAAFDFFNMRGSTVGGSSTYTQIVLTNNNTTTIQNGSAYDAVELSGFIYINATTKYRFSFMAQLTKKGDGTGYLLSFQTSGDTPPAGFNIAASTGTTGLVQVTLPSIAGFGSAITQFTLNGPSVGVTLPLSIDSSNVSFGTIQAKDSNGIVFNNSSSTNIATITNAGYLLTPNIPAFYAWQSGGVFNTITGAFGAIAPVFGNTRLNINSCYNTSNGRFTAPVNGVYEFHFGIIHRYSSAAGSLEPTFYLNGSNISPRGCSYSWVTGTGDHDWVHTHMMIYMTAGQYMQCGIHACTSGTDYYYGDNLGYFSGKLIG